MKKIFLINTVIASLMIFVSCSQYSFDPPETIKGKKITSTTTIKYLEETFMVTDFLPNPGRPDHRNEYNTADPIRSNDSLVFNGIVTSNDLMGNMYKYIVVQEDNSLTSTPRAIRISIDANNVSNIYPTGQRVSVIANGWYIGKYGNTPQMGTYYRRPLDERLSPGTMPMSFVRKTVIAYDTVDIKAVVPKEMTIAQIKSYASHHHDIDWQLIKIKNVFFNQQGDAVSSSNQPSDRIIFAPSTDEVDDGIDYHIGYPQAVQIQDESGQTIEICTSEYARFANTTIPAASYKGDITCIVSWYQSRPGFSGSFQLTLRSLQDLGRGFEGYLQSVNN